MIICVTSFIFILFVCLCFTQHVNTRYLLILIILQCILKFVQDYSDWHFFIPYEEIRLFKENCRQIFFIFGCSHFVEFNFKGLTAVFKQGSPNIKGVVASYSCNSSYLFCVFAFITMKLNVST